MRHQARFLGDEVQQIVVDFSDIDGTQAQTWERWDIREQTPDHLSQPGLARKIDTIGGDIDTGENDFTVAVLDQSGDLFDDGPDRDAAGIAASEGDDAEGAAMITAVLYLDEGACPPIETSY